jgi:hypothetical protein
MAPSISDTVTAAQIAQDETNASEMTDRTRPSSVLRATFDNNTVVTDSRFKTTHRDIHLTVGGVNDEYLVAATGIEPVTLGL